LALKSSPEQTGIKTNILSARDNLGSSIVKLEEWKLVPVHGLNAYAVV
jgi:hypothetical protein